jgi:hypothetical protein
MRRSATFLAVAIVLFAAHLAGQRAGWLEPRAATAAPARTLAVASLQCSGGFVTASFAWLPGGDAFVQWVDLTSWNAGFAPGTYGGWGPLAGNQSSLAWPGLYPNLTYYVRVNSLTAGGWQPSQTLIFRTGSCLASYPGATNLRVAGQDCRSGGWAEAEFTWEPSGLGIQFVDLTTINAGFAPFTYAGWGPLAAGVDSLSWPGLFPGITYYVRVNTLTASGWWPSETLAFTARRACAEDAEGATNLNLIAQQCQTAEFVLATFNWNPSGAGQQWLDLTSLNFNFAPGTYASWGPLTVNANSLAWPGLYPNVTYYVRVLTLTAAG